jgi:hypothetical protein
MFGLCAATATDAAYAVRAIITNHEQRQRARVIT